MSWSYFQIVLHIDMGVPDSTRIAFGRKIASNSAGIRQAVVKGRAQEHTDVRSPLMPTKKISRWSAPRLSGKSMSSDCKF